MKPFKHNTVQDVDLVHRSCYSNLMKPFKHNTIQDASSVHWSYYSSL